MSHHQIVIVGGGTAGITVASRLLNIDSKLDIAVIEPSEKHYYQPLWTLVGGGMFPREESERAEEEVMPNEVTWIRDFVVTFAPTENKVVLKDGTEVTYDYLIVAAGLQLNWDKVKGLRESLGTNGVCSNYSYATVGSTWENIRNLKKGVALFTQPAGVVKCGGAPQKICYLAEDYFRKQGVRENIDVIFTLAGARIFAVEKYARALEKVVARKGIDVRFRHDLIEVRADQHEAVYRHMDTNDEIDIKYDMIHVTPPMGVPDFVAQSELAGEGGYVDVDPYTLQHIRYKNVYSLGDVSSLPTSKTGAAIRKQAPAVVQNLLAQMHDLPLPGRYDGYTSCPVVTGYNSLILAEFNYDKEPEETFAFNQAQERFSMLMLKKYGLPAMYWHGMLKGRV